MEIRDYFRLIRLRFHNRETLRVTVKPDLVTLDELRCADLSQTTAKDNPMNRTEPDVIVRKYDPGDLPINRNSAESLIREEMRLTRDVNELRGESILIAAKLMEVSKVTEVSKLVETRKLGIHAVKEPPMQFVMDKFYRADSLIKIDPKFERTYDDLDYELQN